MVLLEVPAAIRRATKYDLFTGELDNLLGQQGVKDNATVFYRDFLSNEITGPHTIYTYSDFLDIYRRLIYGKCGVLTAVPYTISNEFVFDLVLREAEINDVKDTPRHIKQNRLYYTYVDKHVTGPFYIDNTITSLYLENLIAKKQLFVPNERQHFKKRTLQKAS